MNTLRLVAAAAILITSQAHATAPVVKNIGCPSDVPCANNGHGSQGGGSGSGGGGGNGGAKPAVAAPVQTPPTGPKITGISLGSNKVVDGQVLDVTVTGVGKACNYYLTLTNTQSHDEWPVPKTSAFPAPDKFAIDLNGVQYPHGTYKFSAKAMANDVRPGVTCLGEVTSTPFDKARIKMVVDFPQIVSVRIEPGKKMGGVDRYRTDEAIRFNVVGSVENTDPKDDSKRCGWTLELVDSNQVAKIIATNSQFGVWQNSMPLTGLAQGAYTLTVKTTGADDGKAKQGCLGKATKQVDVFAVPGVITGVHILAYGILNLTVQDGRAEITPQIAGETCFYKVTRFVAGAGTRETMHVHVKGKSDLIAPQDVYPNDKTIVDITVSGTGAPGSCEGSAHKTVIVYDNGKPVNY